MPTVKDKITGEVISRQPYDEEGAQNASTIAQGNPSWEVTYDYPASDASARSQNTDIDTYMGGGTPDIGAKLDMYKKGGKVSEYHGGGRVGHKHTKTGDVAYDSDYAPGSKHANVKKGDSWHKGQRDAEEKIHEEAAIKGTIVGQEIAEALEGKGDVTSVMKSDKEAQKSLGAYAPKRKTYKKAVKKAAKK